MNLPQLLFNSRKILIILKEMIQIWTSNGRVQDFPGLLYCIKLFDSSSRTQNGCLTVCLVEWATSLWAFIEGEDDMFIHCLIWSHTAFSQNAISK